MPEAFTGPEACCFGIFKCLAVVIVPWFARLIPKSEGSFMVTQKFDDLVRRYALVEHSEVLPVKIWRPLSLLRFQLDSVSIL